MHDTQHMATKKSSASKVQTSTASLEAAMVAAYDDFYAGEPAPLPEGVAPAGIE